MCFLRNISLARPKSTGTTVPFKHIGAAWPVLYKLYGSVKTDREYSCLLSKTPACVFIQSHRLSSKAFLTFIASRRISSDIPWLFGVLAV